MKAWRSIAAILLLNALTTTADAANFSIRSTDSAGVGLNDATAFTPVGGNSATTLGQARMNVLLEAARILGNAFAKQCADSSRRLVHRTHLQRDQRHARQRRSALRLSKFRRRRFVQHVLRLGASRRYRRHESIVEFHECGYHCNL